MKDSVDNKITRDRDYSCDMNEHEYDYANDEAVKQRDTSIRTFGDDQAWDHHMSSAIQDVCNQLKAWQFNMDARTRTITFEMTDKQFFDLQAQLNYYTSCIGQEIDQEIVTKHYPEIGDCLREAEVLEKLYNVDVEHLRDDEYFDKFDQLETEILTRDNIWYQRQAEGITV
tara:strand:+ start:447 stop:959 length:513 start_codon:yes stop_codon:yes gene_type:complete